MGEDAVNDHDWDDEGPDDDDWYDDDPVHVKEEPDCYACNDSGFTYPDGKRCRSCNPSRLRHWWWRRTGRIRFWWFRRRFGHRNVPASNEPPF